MGILDAIANFYKVKAPPVIDNRNILYGYDLDQWNYIGQSKCYYYNKKREDVSAEAYIQFFEHKETKARDWCYSNGTKRSVSFAADFAEHPFLISVRLWTAKEKEIYQLIQEPSKYLKEYMTTAFSQPYVYDYEKKQWVEDKKPQSKYAAAVKKQKSTVVKFKPKGK